MKPIRYFIFIGALFLSSLCKGQQEVLYTQYVFSQLAVNPSYAGNDNGLSLTALSRKQWFGLQGSPTSFSFLGHTALGKEGAECRSLAGGAEENAPGSVG